MKNVNWQASWQLSAVALIDMLIGAATFNSLGVVLPHMVKELDWSWSQAGVGFTLLGACCGGSAWLPPKLIRRFGLRATLFLGAGLLALGLYGLSRVGNLLHYYVATAMCGVAFQLMGHIPGTFVITRAFKERRGAALGVYSTIGGFGNVLAPLMVLWVMGATNDDWRAYWTFQSASILIFGLACAAIIGLDARFARPAREELDKPAGEKTPRAAGPGRIYRTPESWSVKAATSTYQFYVLMGGYFASLFCLVTVTALSVGHLTERGVAPSVAAAMLSLEALIAVVTRATGGVLADHVDPRWLMASALGAMSCGCLMLTFGQTQPWLLLYAVGTGLGFGLAQLCCTMLMLNYFGERHNLELFSTMLLVGAVSALGPVLGGVIRDTSGSFVGMFLLTAIASGAACIACAIMRPPRLSADPVRPLESVIAGQ